MTHQRIINRLLRNLKPLKFAPPVRYVYNPLLYARPAYEAYLDRFGQGDREIVLVGMNPGPWGMAQTGVPFGEIRSVRDWMGIQADVGRPENPHPARPVSGFSCPRSEVSGQRLWGWARDRYKTPRRFFSRFFVANYCPLMFMEESGRNRTPDKLRKEEKRNLFSACDLALQETVKNFDPKFVIGIGGFAASRVSEALAGFALIAGRITHPSPANPKAARNWPQRIEKELESFGIRL